MLSSDGTCQPERRAMPVKPISQVKCSYTSSNVLVKQIVQIIIVPSAFPSLYFDSFLLLLLFGHGSEDVLELLFGDLLSQLAASCQHDQSVLDIFGAFSFDDSDSAKTICGGWFEDLRKNGCARIGWERCQT